MGDNDWMSKRFRSDPVLCFVWWSKYTWLQVIWDPNARAQSAFCALHTFFVEVLTNFCIHAWRLELQAPLVSCDYPLYKYKHVNIYFNSFWVKLINVWDFRPVITGVSENIPATSACCQQFFEDFQTLPKILWSCYDNFWEILKLFQASKANWIEFLSLIMC